ncbi:hypothetical protein QUF80_02400 [Desulfococcaceae bacterium HSG8]|nr:hypothetical protein [Desulfococcaceae bacterium HSG8]
MSVVSCQLPVVSRQLSVVSCQLPVVSCQLPVASCQLSVASCQLILSLSLFCRTDKSGGMARICQSEPSHAEIIAMQRTTDYGQRTTN